MRLAFYGGAKTVTGANHLLDTGKIKILIDCGLFQGSRFAETLNYEKFPYNPEEIDYLLLTHAHADHVGRVPKLYNEGFRGKIFAVHPTIDLTKVSMPNSLSLIRDEAKEDGHEPLFREEDLINSLLLAQGVDYGQTIDLDKDTKAEFKNAGHILGSSIVEITHKNTKICFSGDLGNPPNLLFDDPDTPSADYVVVESAYGGRVHENRKERRAILGKIIDETVVRGGTLMIPVFALERTQEILYELNGLFLEKLLPNVPIFLDSPLGISLTGVYENYPDYFNSSARKLINGGDDVFSFPQLHLTNTVDKSKAINKIQGPKIIMAGSGMSNGGRILHHESRYLADPQSAIMFVGYQVENSLGRRILGGAKKVKIYGQTIPVNCKVVAIGGYSGHADQKFILEWLAKADSNRKIKNVFIVQGELKSEETLAEKIKEKLKLEVSTPSLGDSFELK